MPLLLTIISFQSLWLIYIKSLKNPTGTVCKLLNLIADCIQLDFYFRNNLVEVKEN